MSALLTRLLVSPVCPPYPCLPASAMSAVLTCLPTHPQSALLSLV